ncbi:hypothetical protein L1887_17842 [Cichorium endivia]|nr:hypothetical protein L1887_17842 [Cichorium endivia]
MGSSRKYQRTPQCVDKIKDVVDRWSGSAHFKSIRVRRLAHEKWSLVQEIVREKVSGLLCVQEEIVDRFDPEEESW